MAGTVSGTDANQPDNTTDATKAEAQAAAGLLVVAPGVVLSSSGSPVSGTTDTNNTGTTATTTATTDQTTAVTEAQSRAEQFRLRQAVAPQALPQTIAARTAAANTTAATTASQTLPTTTTQTQPTTDTTTNTTAAIPGTPANPFVTATTAQTPTNATGLPAGRSPVIPAQAPVVTDLIPQAPTPPLPLDTPPQAVAATTATSALPNVQIGDRPAMAGERLAAIVADANRLKATTAQPTDGLFAGVLATTAAQTVTPTAVPTTAAVTGAPIAPASLVVPSAVPLPDGQGLNATLTGGADQFIMSGVTGRLSGNGNGQPAAFADLLRDQATDATSAAQPGTIAPTTQPTLPSVAQTAPAAQTHATTATPAAQVADGVVAHAHTLERTGSSEFQMRLDPPELGRVHVRLISDGDSIRGQVVVADDSVRKMIESQLPELRQRLEQAGVSVGQFNVSTDPNSGGNGQAFRGNGPFDVAPPAASATPRQQLRPADRSVAGRLDVTV